MIAVVGAPVGYPLQNNDDNIRKQNSPRHTYVGYPLQDNDDNILISRNKMNSNYISKN